MKSTRNSNAKTEIQKLLSSSSVALSHLEIQNALGGLCDRVTIYRVLARLVEDGHIHKIVNMDGVLKFANCHGCTDHHNHSHIHFSCEKCKSLTCLENTEPSFKIPEKYVVKEMNFTLSGLCPKCSE